MYIIVYGQNRLAIEQRMSKAFHRTSYCTYLQCLYIGMYVCASLCACPCLCVSVCGCVYSCLHVPASTYVNVYVLTLRRHACIRVSTYVRTYMYALFMHVCMYASLHVCIYAVCMHQVTHTHTLGIYKIPSNIRDTSGTYIYLAIFYPIGLWFLKWHMHRCEGVSVGCHSVVSTGLCICMLPEWYRFHRFHGSQS